MNATTPEDFAIDLASLTTHPDHLWVGSGSATAHPVPGTVMAVRGFFSPPYAAPDLLLDVTLAADGHMVHDWGAGGGGDVGLLYAGGRWMPHAIERIGTYHHRKDGHIRSLYLRARLVPLVSRAGFLLMVEIENRSPSPCSIAIHPELKPGRPRLIPLSDWAYPKPSPGREEALPCGPGCWQNSEVTLRMACENLRFQLAPGATNRFSCTVVAGGDAPMAAADELEAESLRTWQNRLDTYLAAMPKLTGTNPDLEAYYRRSLISGLVCFWETPGFVMQPHIATSGLDGGALCSYLWDLGGYAPQTLALMLGDKAVAIAQEFARMDLTRYYAMAPDGHPVGVAYAYSVWSFVQMVWAICVQHGLREDLFVEARRLVLALELRADERCLVDFGGHDALLEMRGTGWEHVVASPNAERAHCLRRLADLADFSGGPADLSADWRKRADAIEQAIRDHLWDKQAGWFRCLHPGGHSELVFSIQAFDALRAGACSPDMKTDLLRHLVEDGFLGRYGLSSVAKADTLHYELNDPDWSGGGAYSGEGPQLALTLYEAGEPALAWDLLRRNFWMGRHYPYFPQESYADRPQSPPQKRANIISGLTAAEAILFGLFGLQPGLDGSLSIHPHPPEGETITLTGLGYRGHTLDVTLNKGLLAVAVDGSAIYEGPPRRIQAISGKPR
ncbi:MAG: hypothetical protein WCS65_12930 [Verrucomicrobiae bacterium]